MKNTTKMILCAVAGAVIFREIYACGYNRGVDDVCDRFKLIFDVYESGKKVIKEES